MIRPSRTFTVVPTIPPALSALEDLAYNLRWTWDHQTAGLFRRLDPARWEATNHNPVLLLRSTDQVRLNEAARDPGYRRELAGAEAELKAYLDADGADQSTKPRVAYFSAEFGLAECLPIYSGGLGVLSGDHLKSASDLNLNLTGVSLFYKHGYFLQRLRPDGWQEEQYPENDPASLPIKPALGADGEQVRITLAFPGRPVHAQVWRVQVGRITLFLMDTDVEENQPADRAITSRLYGGDRDMRIRQELLLGIGGLRALDILGRRPEVCHLNEGHSSFLTLERIRQLMVESDLTFDEARAMAAAGMVFTTHTPVAAGHDAFHHELLLVHFGDFIRELGLPIDRFLALGAAPTNGGMFNMTRLALNGSRHVNGVSRLHGQVSARLCADHWREVRPDDNPVGYVTNGIHVPTFLHQKWAEYFDEVAGPQWRERLSDAAFWKVLERVSDRAFWSSGQTVKSDMLGCVRERLRREFVRKGQSAAQWRHVAKMLDPARPDILTIGFARRFATYKRASLIMRDRARLARIVNNPERPVVFLFAGKAHPADQPGQAVLREIKQVSLQPEFIGKIVFLEDYDIQLARWLVSGCDVWLNNPIAPLEASGTSGIKAAVNGRLNLSVLDGWWDEGFDEDKLAALMTLGIVVPQVELPP